jgi:hypothetical protein
MLLETGSFWQPRAIRRSILRTCAPAVRHRTHARRQSASTSCMPSRRRCTGTQRPLAYLARRAFINLENLTASASACPPQVLPYSSQNAARPGGQEGPITLPIIRARCPRCAYKWPAAYVLRCTERFSMPRVLRCLTLEGRSAFPADRHWVRVIYPLWMMTTPHVLCICAGDGNFSAVAACLCAGARSCGSLDIYQLHVRHFRTMTNSPRCMLT